MPVVGHTVGCPCWLNFLSTVATQGPQRRQCVRGCGDFVVYAHWCFFLTNQQCATSPHHSVVLAWLTWNNGYFSAKRLLVGISIMVLLRIKSYCTVQCYVMEECHKKISTTSLLSGKLHLAAAFGAGDSPITSSDHCSLPM